MNGYKENLSEVVEKESHLRVVHGDDANYTVKGFGSISLQNPMTYYILMMCFMYLV